MSSEPLRSLFQWSDDEEEASGYASSATVSSEQTGILSANMVDNNHNDNLHLVYEGPRADFQSSTSSSGKYPADVGAISEQPEQ